jgi:leucyl aminopeptidase (aminopeptidase T)
MADPLLEPSQLRRYADAITKASLGVTKGDVLLVQGSCAHRELVVAVAEAGYRAGAEVVDVSYYDAPASSTGRRRLSVSSLPGRSAACASSSSRTAPAQ